jgi:hypothetical protein
MMNEASEVLERYGVVKDIDSLLLAEFDKSKILRLHRDFYSVPEAGSPIRIKLRDEDYGNFRARWADHEGEPNLLLVSARHKSLSRYLGPPPDFEGQNAPLFRVLLAEIVAESVCRKSLTLESKERTWEFRWADLKEDYLIADDVFAKFQQRMRDFVADAHGIMLSDSEVTKATGEGR